VGQLLRLLVKGVHNHRIVIAQRIHADAAGQIDICLSLNIPERRALAVVKRNRETGIGVHDILLFFSF
jgi:hypothetical protein